MKHKSRAGVAVCAVLFAVAFMAGPSNAAAVAKHGGEATPTDPAVAVRDDPGVFTQASPTIMAGNALAGCPVPGEGETTICLEPLKKDPKVTKDKSDGLTQMTIQQVPSWCSSAGVMPEGQHLVTRFESCGNWGYTLYVYHVTNGIMNITGSMQLTLTDFHYGAKDLPSVAHQITIIPSNMNGSAVGATATATASCNANCTPGSQNFGTQALTPGVGVSGEFFWTTTATTPGAVATTTSKWNINFNTPTAENTAAIQATSAPVRCDTAVPGVTTTGCVHTASVPAIQYQGLQDFGAHIQAAQQSGLPGGMGSPPLHRLTNESLKTANRNKACPSSYPRPTGKSCDEYPFASTYEGAFTGGGEARTFPWCQITLTNVPSTGPTGFSVCMIDSTQNSYAGSVLNSSLYVPYRFLDGDAFRVWIV